MLGLSGCRDGRPESEEAWRHFVRLYPDAEIIDIKISEDEVVARSFTVRYRCKETDEEKEMAIQFMKAKPEGEWVPNPPPPRILP